MGEGVGGVFELVDEDRAGLGCDALGHILIVFRVTLAHVGAGQDDFCAQGLEVEDLLLRHLVRDDQGQVIALLRGDQRQAQAGVACGCLDQPAARLQAAVLLGGLDHGLADAVLDGAARVLTFELQEKAAGPCIHLPDLDQRGVADRFQNVSEDGRIDGHAAFPAIHLMLCKRKVRRRAGEGDSKSVVATTKRPQPAPRSGSDP